MTDINQTIRNIVRDEARAEFQRLLAENLPSFDDEYLTTKEVAALTKRKVSFFEKGRTQGHPDQPPHYRRGHRILYKKSQVIAWVEGRQS